MPVCTPVTAAREMAALPSVEPGVEWVESAFQKPHPSDPHMGHQTEVGQLEGERGNRCWGGH